MTAPEQLTFDGGSVAHPPRRTVRLTERQTNLVRYVRFRVETHGSFPTRDARALYADPAGALRRLEAIGLIHREGRGRWTT